MLRSAAFAILLEIGAIAVPRPVVADPATPEQQKKNRSRFEYNDGSPDEKRPYRRPDLDVDPRNLTLEEMRERLNALEERLERLENQSNSSKGVR